MTCHVEHWPGGRSIVTTGYANAADGTALCRVGLVVDTRGVEAFVRAIEHVSKPAVRLFDYEARGIGLTPVAPA